MADWILSLQNQTLNSFGEICLNCAQHKHKPWHWALDNEARSCQSKQPLRLSPDVRLTIPWTKLAARMRVCNATSSFGKGVHFVTRGIRGIVRWNTLRLNRWSVFLILPSFEIFCCYWKVFNFETSSIVWWNVKPWQFEVKVIFA